ncbi:MAG: NADH-quinone oxidoreductase subunit NuoF [Actinomycetota bacterium]|nr:NADH-quinone oxidoreductase subunit NuoF [Actinomycetota bacterium]
MTKLVPNLSAHWDEADSHTLTGYQRHGGYTAMKKAFELGEDGVIAEVKESGLRGRGGAGFPTGMKWGFVPQGDGKPHYLVVNADESEPGACKDIPLMMLNPHSLIEGVIIAAYAIRANYAFIYIRGETPHPIRRVRQAVAAAYEAKLLGKNILGTGFNLEVVVHSGAGAYICGEETALLDSLEGRRGQPRLKPPFPAVAGLYASPTVVNNVETVASVPAIIKNGAAWYKSFGTEKSPGIKLFAVSGDVLRPGIFEASLGITMRELINYAGGMVSDRPVKFFVPGGSSVPLLTPEHLDVPLTYEDMAAHGTMLGTGTPMVFDTSRSVTKAVVRWIEFYKHESCGKCTPCREGTYFMVDILKRLEKGKGELADLDLLVDISAQISGRSFCALGDAAATPIPAALKYFREEFESKLVGAK